MSALDLLPKKESSYNVSKIGQKGSLFTFTKTQKRTKL